MKRERGEAWQSAQVLLPNASPARRANVALRSRWAAHRSDPIPAFNRVIACPCGTALLDKIRSQGPCPRGRLRSTLACFCPGEKKPETQRAIGQIERERPWHGRHRPSSKSASVSRSTAICRPNSSFSQSSPISGELAVCPPSYSVPRRAIYLPQCCKCAGSRGIAHVKAYTAAADNGCDVH